MELKLEQGRYVPGAGGLLRVTGANEIAQRVMMKLTARRGGFAPLPEYGSALYTLLHTARPSEYETAAMQYIAQALADEAGLRVVHATGYYKEPFLPRECYSMSRDDMARLFVREIREGMEDTGLRASFIGEIGTGKGAVAPMERMIFEAACTAHRETGASICTHTTLGTLGMEQLEIFKSYSVDLSKVVLSHIDLSGDVDYMLRLLDSGVNIAFDTVGKNNYQPDQGRVEWLTALCQKGYAGQILLSMDLTRLSNVRELGYRYLLDRFIPALLERGFRREWLSALLTENPTRIYQL